MSKRWTEEDLKKLPAGSVVKDMSAKSTQATAQVEKAANNVHVQATGQLPETRMNKTEARFAQLLDLQKHAGELLWWEYEPMNLRIGQNCYYRIDFMAMKADGHLVAYEVKGKWEDDALVKIRAAAEKFPWPFIAVQWVKGGWEYRNF